MPCIYCLKSLEGRPPRAHIFSESIFGDHDELVLANGEVCGNCNNRLAKLEAPFKDRLGLIPMFVGPGVNKGGRPTTISAPGLSGTRDPRDPRISVNLGKQPWTSSDGRGVRPALKPGEKVEFEPTGQGPDGYRFSLRHEMRVDAVFVRILAKIGFETICLHRGADYCAAGRWNRVRSFILKGEGDRTYFMPRTLSMPVRPDGGVSVPVGITLAPVEVLRNGEWMEEWLASIRVGPSLIIDMSIENDVLPDLLETMPLEVREAGFLKTCHGSARGMPH